MRLWAAGGSALVRSSCHQARSTPAKKLTALWPFLPAMMAAMQAQISQRMMKVASELLVASAFGPASRRGEGHPSQAGAQGGLPTVG